MSIIELPFFTHCANTECQTDVRIRLEIMLLWWVKGEKYFWLEKVMGLEIHIYALIRIKRTSSTCLAKH